MKVSRVMDIGIVIRLRDKLYDIMTETERDALHELITFYQNNIGNVLEKESVEEENVFSPVNDYTTFVEWCKDNAPKVLRMERPITEKQYKDIVSKFGLKSLHEILMDMDNWKPLLKQNTNAGRTAINWLEMREQKRLNF